MIELFILKISLKSSKTTAIHMLSVSYSVLHNFLLFAFIYKLLLIKYWNKNSNILKIRNCIVSYPDSKIIKNILPQIFLFSKVF